MFHETFYINKYKYCIQLLLFRIFVLHLVFGFMSKERKLLVYKICNILFYEKFFET